MIDLTETTFISVIKIESQDRLENLKSVLGYIDKHFSTNFLIFEIPGMEYEFDWSFENIKVRRIASDSDYFHRTRFLNTLLKLVKTKVTCVYDIDVILPVETYEASQSAILGGVFHFLYPFGMGWSQRRVFQSFDRTEFNKTFDLSLIDGSNDYDTYTSAYGHVFFASTEAYLECGGENENFVSYGPEDVERFVRFAKLGKAIGRIAGVVYHFEHSRGPDSGPDNAAFQSNNAELELIRSLSKEEVQERIPSL